MELSVRPVARAAGLLWLLVIVFGVFAEFGARDRLITGGNLITARNIVGGAAVWRLGFAADLVASACYLGVVVLVSRLLEPAGPMLARLALAFGIAGTAIGGLALIFHLGALIVLKDPIAPGAAPQQAQALMRLLLRLHATGVRVALVFFSGVFLSLTGVLAWRSDLLPRWLGALMAVAGACYLINSFCGFLVPSSLKVLLPWILLPCLAAELAAALWLLFRVPGPRMASAPV